MGRLVTFSVAAALLTSCQSQPRAFDSIKVGHPTALSNTDQQAIAAGIQGQVKDPTSVIISGVQGSIDSDGVVSACGYVNGKNSYGAYTGNMPFAGMLATNNVGRRVFLVSGIGDGGTGSAAISMLCAKKGIPV